MAWSGCLDQGGDLILREESKEKLKMIVGGWGVQGVQGKKLYLKELKGCWREFFQLTACS